MNITPEQAADAFCQFDALEQADFLKRVEEISRRWNQSPYYQWQAIATEMISLDPQGRYKETMEMISEWSGYFGSRHKET